jgi:hypothetical protein
MATAFALIGATGRGGRVVAFGSGPGMGDPPPGGACGGGGSGGAGSTSTWVKSNVLAWTSGDAAFAARRALHAKRAAWRAAAATRYGPKRRLDPRPLRPGERSYGPRFIALAYHSAAMQTFDGGCHCGSIRFRVMVDDAQEIIECNCSVCTKKGILHFIVPEERFALVQGADAVATYSFNTGVAKHMFCRTCGIHPFYRPRSHPLAWDVNVRCLDDTGVVDRFPRRAFDGRDWEANVASLR